MKKIFNFLSSEDLHAIKPYLPMITKVSLAIAFGRAKDYPIRHESSWEEEKDDILERANVKRVFNNEKD